MVTLNVLFVGQIPIDRATGSDDALVLFRSIADIAASLKAADSQADDQ
jgi:hypothetical protein